MTSTLYKLAMPTLLLCSLPAILPAQQVGFIEHALPSTNFGPSQITTGPDGALWFTLATNAIGRVTVAGAVTEYNGPPNNGLLSGIAAGPDGALWFTDTFNGAIGRVTTSGIFTDYPLPSFGNTPYAITAGPDGALWFTNWGANTIGRITTSGVITQYPLPVAGCGAFGIVPGPDGALWFTENVTGRIGRITTSGSISEFQLQPNSGPAGITVGPDGALWFTQTSSIGRITTTGSVTEYPVTIVGDPNQIVAGPDGALWFTLYSGNPVNNIGRISTTGSISAYPIPSGNSSLNGITVGPDGDIWFAEQAADTIVQAAFTTATLSAAPDSGVPGKEIMISGSGFAPGETVKLFGNSTSINLLNSAAANGSGAFVISGEARQSPYGPNSVVGIGQTSGKIAVAPFTTNPLLTLTPSSATPGATVTVNGFGFGVSETVTIYSGKPVSGTPLGTASTNTVGTFSQAGGFTFTIPASAKPGQYQISAQGGASLATTGVALTVE